ncbi:hypothetical protein, partial [Xanthomonas vasicola]
MILLRLLLDPLLDFLAVHWLAMRAVIPVADVEASPSQRVRISMISLLEGPPPPGQGGGSLVVMGQHSIPRRSCAGVFLCSFA